MSNKVYVITWVGDYESGVSGVYTTLEKAKQELAKIADNCIVTQWSNSGLSFSTAGRTFHGIEEANLYT